MMEPRTTCNSALFILRLVLGVIMFAHGAQKVLGIWGGYGMNETVKFFQETWGIPPVLTYLSMAAEFLGGIGLIVGLLGRVASLGIAVNMAVAIALAHWNNGFFNDKQGFEFPLALLAMALALLLTGMGVYSLDAMLVKKKKAPV
ncbi:MAG: DoxX family protein [Candidatus Caldarchaeum sp.]